MTFLFGIKLSLDKGIFSHNRELIEKALAHTSINNSRVTGQCLFLIKTEIHNHITGLCYLVHMRVRCELK